MRAYKECGEIATPVLDLGTYVEVSVQPSPSAALRPVKNPITRSVGG